MQSITCLHTDVCLTGGPGVMGSISAQFYSFVEIDHEIISTIIFLPFAESLKKECSSLCTLWSLYL